MPYRAEDGALAPEARLLLQIEQAPIDDLERLLNRLTNTESASELTVYSSRNRGLSEEEAELMISAAYYASLSAYRRDGEEPKDKFFGRVHEIHYLLDRVRDELIRLLPSARVALRQRRQGVPLARAWSIAYLALDAVPADDAPSMAMFSPIPPASQDLVGDAQAWAEDYHEGSEELPRAIARIPDPEPIDVLPPPIVMPIADTEPLPAAPKKKRTAPRYRVRLDGHPLMPSLFDLAAE